MGNIIKIPTTNTGLNLQNGSPLLDTNNWVLTEGAVGGNNYTNQPVTTTTDGDGQGFVFGFYFYENGEWEFSVNSTITTVNYKVGDKIFFTIEEGSQPLNPENTFSFETTITASMLSNEGDKMQYLPVFSSLNGIVLTVIPPPTGLSNYWQIPKPWGGHENCWRINIDGGTDTNRAVITKAINEVFIEAAQAPNSHPTLRLPNGITCSGVDYTQIQIQPEPGPGPGQA